MRVQLTLFENATVATPTAGSDSGWLEISMMLPGGTLDVRGVGAGDAVQLYVSNRPGGNSADRAADQGQTLGAPITAAAMVILTASYRWIKAIRTTTTGLPVSIYVNGPINRQ